MGVRGLSSLIEKYSPDALNSQSFKYFKGSTIAVDTSILLYKFRYSTSNPNSHISGFLNKCLCYMRNGIIPIFILDGKPPPEKNSTITKRNRQREKIEKKIHDLKEKINSDNEKETIMKIQKLNKQIITVTKEHHSESKKLLELLGFVVISSPGEAESVCALLQNKGLVDFTFSDDMDTLALGCSKVLRSNIKEGGFMMIELDKVLIGLKLNFNEFVDLCILCGCDYCPSIPKINYEEAYKIILKYRTIENFISNNSDYEIPDNFKYQIARNIFNNDTTFNMNQKIGKIPMVNEHKLIKFLLDKHFKKKYIYNYIQQFYNARKEIPNIKKSDSTEYFSRLV